MHSLFTTKVFEEINQRIKNLESNQSAIWGKMNPAQMLAHCSKPLELALNKSNSIEKPPVLKKMILSLFKKQMYNNKQWNKNLPTPKHFKVNDNKDFDLEKNILKSILLKFHQEKDRINWGEHPMFGKFTPEQWGKMQYKHLDHHLRQFGV
jgi:hypothetical protein